MLSIYPFYELSDIKQPNAAYFIAHARRKRGEQIVRKTGYIGKYFGKNNLRILKYVG